jgi:hypothetical protein
MLQPRLVRGFFCEVASVGAGQVREQARSYSPAEHRSALRRSELAREQYVGRITRQRYPPGWHRRVTRSGLSALRNAKNTSSSPVGADLVREIHRGGNGSHGGVPVACRRFAEKLRSYKSAKDRAPALSLALKGFQRNIRTLRSAPFRRPKSRGHFSRSEKPDGGARLFGSFWEGGYPTFDKRDSPEGAKHRVRAHAEAAQNTQSKSIAEKLRSYAGRHLGVAL